MYEGKKQKLDYLIDNLNKILIKKYESAKHKFELLKNNYILSKPEMLYKDKQIKLNNLIEKLELINPLGILKRGYTLTYQDDKLINSINNIKTNNNITIKMHDGIVDAKVLEVKEK